MRVKVESTGGFTGKTTVVARYDTAALPAGKAGRIREAVNALAAAQARGERGEIGADLPGYRITVEDGADGPPRVYEVRGDPTVRAPSVLGTLLHGPAE